MNFEQEKTQIQRQLEKEWQEEKKAFQSEEQEETEGQNAILRQIEDSKEKYKKLTQRHAELDKSVKREQTYSEDLLIDKKIKLKELSD